jgi:hypothetical protein
MNTENFSLNPKSGVHVHVDPTLPESRGPDPGTPRDRCPWCCRTRQTAPYVKILAMPLVTEI